MTNKLILVIFVLSAIVIWGCSPEVEERTEQSLWDTKGNLVIVGGGPRPDNIMQKVVDLSSDGTFLLIPMASSIPDTIGWEQRDQLLGFGATQVDILMLTQEDKDDPALLEQLRNANGIWFSGGDQNRLMNYFTDAMRDAVREAFRNGAVIAGTSAGAAVQSRTMITGDETHPLSDRFSPFSQITKDNVITSDGFGFLSSMVIDQHFIRRNRLNRLINVLIDSPEDVAAAGIDEATALWFAPDGRVEVIGESQVILIEKDEDFTRKYSASLPAASNLKMHILPPGSVFYWNGQSISRIQLAGY